MGPTTIQSISCARPFASTRPLGARQVADPVAKHFDLAQAPMFHAVA